MNIFDKAIERLQTKGHFKGAMHGPDGECCAMGAFCDENQDNLSIEDYQAVTLAEQVLREQKAEVPLPDPDDLLAPLARWNDMPERTVEDVILLFKECSVRADEMQIFSVRKTL